MSEIKTATEVLNEGLLSRCGINCRFCPSYKDHIKSDKDKQRCSDLWFKFLGFRVEPETIRPCPGCVESVYYDVEGADGAECAIRKCAISVGAITCAHCSSYRSGCSLHPDAETQTDDTGGPRTEAMTQAERIFFGDLGREQGNRSPEENLTEIRASLRPEDFVDGNPPLEP